MVHVTVATNPPELLRSLQQGGTDPTLEHLTASPPLDVTGVGLNDAVEVLERVGGSKGSSQCTGES